MMRKMKQKLLDAKGKGEYTYDFKNDLLLFKIKDRNYKTSLDFGNLIVDIDEEGFITGLRVFDASQLFGMDKIALNSIQQFEFNAGVEDKVINIQLKFIALLRNKPLEKVSQNFIREALDSNIKDSQAVCSVT